jgi:hypothetical protein
MVPIKIVVLDGLKPHQPSAFELSTALANVRRRLFNAFDSC